MTPVATPDMAVGRGKLADLPFESMESRIRLVVKDLDRRVVFRAQQARPVGAHLAPQIARRPSANEGAARPEALDQLFGLEEIQCLPDRRTGDAALDREIVDGRDLSAHRPLPGLDPAPKQRRELVIARDAAPLEIQRL
jgi:hypothetical protein